jgi:tetratricopeptide (TPR) repeat protein
MSGRAEQQRRRKRRKERRGRRQSQFPSNRIFILDQPRGPVALLSYSISYDALDKPVLPDPAASDEALAQTRDSLHAQMYHDPQSAIPRLAALLQQYPDSPLLMNWLAACHSRLGQFAEVSRLARRNFDLHPDYLFARVNYAQTLLEEGKVKEAGDVMGNKWDLKALYPHRDVFHISEYVAFSAVGVEFLMRTGKPEAANIIFDVMEQVAPDHEATLQLKRIMQGSALLRMAKTLAGSLLRRGRMPT